MPWIKLDVNFLEHPKIDALSCDAKLLYIWGLCYSGRQLTDGFIPAKQVSSVERQSPAAELVTALLWHVVTNGYEIHDYLEHQSSREQVKKVRESTRKRVAKHRVTGGVTPLVTPDVLALEVEVEVEDRTKDKDSLSLVSLGLGDALELANFLADKIASNGSKRPTVSKAWIIDMDRLMRLDGRTRNQVMSAIEWCQNDDFWRSNILSPAKLRSKYDQLRLKASQQSKSTQPKGLTAIMQIRQEEELKKGTPLALEI